jgi:hypothetical protein
VEEVAGDEEYSANGRDELPVGGAYGGAPTRVMMHVEVSRQLTGKIRLSHVCGKEGVGGGWSGLAAEGSVGS